MVRCRFIDNRTIDLKRAVSMTQPLRPAGPGDQILLIDGSSFIFRAYFQAARQDDKYNYRPSDGLPTGAVRLFCAKLLQFLRDGAAGVTPTHIAIVFDAPGGSFRKEIYPEYKGHRPDAPEDLKAQMPLMRAAARAFGFEPVEIAGFEADDIIATYAVQAAERGADALIVSSDKDLMQLIGPHVRFYDFESGQKGKPGYRPERNLDAAAAAEKWEGVSPEKIGDVLALMGDASDNVPGVPGIGLKTAAQLIREYGDLETLLMQASSIKQPKRREALTEHAESARLSKRLVSLYCAAPVPVTLDTLRLTPLDAKPVIAFLKALEVNQLTKRVGDLYGVDPATVEADPGLVSAGPGAARYKGTSDISAPVSDEPVGQITADTVGSPTAFAAVRRQAVAALPVNREAYETVTEPARLQHWVRRGLEAGLVAFDTETTSVDANACDLVGFSLAIAPGEACYVPLQHRSGADLFGGGMTPGQIPLAEALRIVKPLMEDGSVLKIGQNIKYDWIVMKRYGVMLRPLDDTMLISYALDAGIGSHGMDELSRRHLGHETIPYSEVAGSGKSAVTFDRVEIAKAAVYAAEDADITLRLWQALKPRLAAEHKSTVYETLERPLIEVIARMEMRGIGIDRTILSRLSGDFAQSLLRLEAQIHEMAGEKFLLSSPKQTGDILFGKFNLPGAKKTPTGQWATPATLLEELVQAGHELPAVILEWRQLAKLKSTYTDALPGYVNQTTKRVHSSFALASTTTGRLSSSEPNLQNIPIRTEEGRKIRAAFVAQPGFKIVSADYSQIELRVLAHIAEIPQLRQAFAEGIDIHAATASAMFGVPLNDMTSDLRRKAKTINFGIIYGISAFGLAQRLNIPHGEASSFIKQYFERFPGIRDYIEATKQLCRDQGYVSTIFGRACHYPQIRSAGAQERAGIERAAINAPIQGSAADIIRRAMIRMDGALSEAGLAAQMLLQVHDELVFEVPDGEVEATIPVVKTVMENAAAPAITLKVPLAVDAKAARNWDEAH